MYFSKTRLLAAVVSAFAASVFGSAARADETIKIGLSVPLSGSGVVWGKGADWIFKKAAQEVKDTGAFKVKGKVYDFQCISYDNKYTAAEGTNVAQTLLNRDGVKFIAATGTALALALALAAGSLTERQGVLFFTKSWGKSSKGPNFPMTFSLINSPFEIVPAIIHFVRASHTGVKSVALLNASDTSGHGIEAISRPMWETAGIKVLPSYLYERGTTKFQPIAARLPSLKQDIIDLSSVPPADAGQLLKELDVRGFKGMKVTNNGSGIDGIVATDGPAMADLNRKS